MEPTNLPVPEATLLLPMIDTDLITALTRYYLVTIEQQDNDIVLQLYAKT